jgi:GAF domain-containing protein
MRCPSVIDHDDASGSVGPPHMENYPSEPENLDRHEPPQLDWWALQRLLNDTATVQQFLDQFTKDVAADVYDHCSITLPGKGTSAYTVASSDEMTRRLDELQYGQDDGPCLEALRTGRPVVVTDMTSDGRYGSYPQYAAEVGARASLSHPLNARDRQTIGVLNLYADIPLDPDPDLVARVAALAENAAGALTLAQKLADQHQSITQLEAALQSRSTIDQAIGILMAEQRCDPRTAFDLLVAASQNRNVKLREVAASIVAGIVRTDPRQHRPGRY